jgi:hypothetical protein
LSIRLRLIIAALFLLGAGGFVIAALVGDDSSDGPSISDNDAIDAIAPAPEAEVLQQQTVVIDLAAPYRLTSMVISPTTERSAGVDVISEVVVIGGLNRFEFSPEEGKLIEALSPDTNCVFATYIELARPEETLIVEDWCFEVS